MEGKDRIDLDTVRAVVIGRLHVLSQYAKTVTLPVLREELAKADDSCRDLLKRARRLLVKDESRFDNKAKARLDDALSSNRALQTVYQYRAKLQDVWGRTYASHEKLMQALQECASRPRPPVFGRYRTSRVACGDIPCRRRPKSECYS